MSPIVHTLALRACAACGWTAVIAVWISVSWGEGGGGEHPPPDPIPRYTPSATQPQLNQSHTNATIVSQLLRCELEAARADLATEGRRAADETTEEAEKARDRERALQAKMGARLRAAQAEVAATERRMAEHKRYGMREG